MKKLFFISLFFCLVGVNWVHWEKTYKEMVQGTGDKMHEAGAKDLKNILNEAMKEWKEKQEKKQHDQNGLSNIDSNKYLQPQVNLVQNQKWTYIDIEWDVDKSQNGMVMLSKNGKTYRTVREFDKIQLNSPGEYSLSFQIKKDGEFITIASRKIQNKKVSKSTMWQPETGIEVEILFILFGLAGIIYMWYIREKRV